MLRAVTATQVRSYHQCFLRNRLMFVLLLPIAACVREQQPPKSSPNSITSDSLAATTDREVPQMRHDTATVLGLSAEGATLQASYAGTTLRRLRAVYLGEMGRATETFYFDSVLYFVRRGEVRYDAPLSGNVADSVTTTLDLRATKPSVVVRDSLAGEVRALLEHLKSPP